MKLKAPAIGILRGIDTVFFSELMSVSFAAGLDAIEITMNTRGAAEIIARNRDRVPAGKWLGAGTVRNLDEAKEAADAGSMFFVTPNTDTGVIEFAVSKNIPVIAGALTPTEVYTAWRAGADMIKIFPCTPFGPGYLKDLAGPFDQIDLVAVGGITLDNLKDFFEAGAASVGVSSSLFGKTALIKKDIEAISANVKIFTDRCSACRQTTGNQ